MALIPAGALLDDFRMMLREHWAYSWSAAERGRVSCSGAFTWAYRQHGKSIYQGSNRIARRYVKQLIPYAQAQREGLIVPGMAAFKCRRPGDAKYALPGDYQKGGAHYDGDLNDYYHIGLVEDEGHVLNAQTKTTGFVRSPISQNWSHVAYLKDVDYGEEGIPMTMATVKGGRLKLRKAPEKDAQVLLSIPDRSRVQVLSDDGVTWAKVQTQGQTGYVMMQYLEFDDEAPAESIDIVAVRLPRETAEALRDALDDQLPR